MNKNEIIRKLKLVKDQLLNLKRPENEQDFKSMGKEAEKIGYFARDFGMEEWDWPQGVGLYGLNKAQNCLGSQQFEDFVKYWVKNQLKKGLPSKNINTTAPLLTLMDFSENENLCKEWMEWLINQLPRTEENIFQHVTTGDTKQDVKLHEGQIWIDTIFMAILFCAKMGVVYNNVKWREESIYQLLAHIKYLYDKKTNLFYHGWNFNDRNNFSEAFWCRGNSWFTLGIPEYLEIMKGYLVHGVYDYLVNTFRAHVNALLKYQSDNGLWHTLIDDRTSYTEVSGSAAIISGILKGIRLNLLSKDFLDSCLKGAEAVIQQITEDGTVLGVSAGTPIGKTKEDYKKIMIVPTAYGQALTIILLTEIVYFL